MIKYDSEYNIFVLAFSDEQRMLEMDSYGLTPKELEHLIKVGRAMLQDMDMDREDYYVPYT